VGDSIARYVWEVAAPDYELKLTGPTVTLGAAQGLFAGNVYEVEVYVSDSFGAVGVAETKLTGGCSLCLEVMLALQPALLLSLCPPQLYVMYCHMTSAYPRHGTTSI
jgi:hypothetical protein